MASSSHSPTASPGASPPPQPPSHPEAHAGAESHLPHTPLSSSSHTPSRHRKASSLSSPRPVSKITTRTLSLRHSQIQAITDEQLKALRGEDEQQQKQQKESIMVTTPPENLPPSPPLTSQDTDGDGDVDTEEAVDGASRKEREKVEDVTDAWRHRGTGGKQSLEAVVDDEHPLSPVGAFSGEAGADVDLEKGEPRSAQARHSLEVDVADAGVTKPFEVVRKARRPTSPKPPHSSYYVGPPTGSTAYYTTPRGQIGVHHPREIVRIERDYDHGELVQFSSSYPLELQGRITPTQFLETVNALNEGLIRAHSVVAACFDNTLAVLTLWLSPLVLESRYDREMGRLQQLVDALNAELYNPQGLNILWPRKSAFLFLEIEYY